MNKIAINKSIIISKEICVCVCSEDIAARRAKKLGR